MRFCIEMSARFYASQRNIANSYPRRDLLMKLIDLNDGPLLCPNRARQFKDRNRQNNNYL